MIDKVTYAANPKTVDELRALSAELGTIEIVDPFKDVLAIVVADAALGP